jgi:hypothetical protein
MDITWDSYAVSYKMLNTGVLSLYVHTAINVLPDKEMYFQSVSILNVVHLREIIGNDASTTSFSVFMYMESHFSVPIKWN